MNPLLEDFASAYEDQLKQVVELAGTIDAHALTPRPQPEKWSMVEHLDHLNRVNGPYLAAMETAIRNARSGQAERAPFYPMRRLIGAFVRSMEPPPKRRFKTLKRMKPAADLDPEAVLAEFGTMQRALAAAARGAEGVELSKWAFRSPFSRLLRFTLHQGFELLAAHNRRHIWHLETIVR